NMPVMDGIETLARLRRDEEYRELPVLVVTGHDDRDERNRILKAGASNHISKPIDGDILVERVRHLVETKRLHDQLSEFHARLTSELATAAKMQRAVVPTPADVQEIKDLYGVSLASQFIPTSELGGDYWTLQVIDDAVFGLMIADFTGHGISAALNTFRLDMLLSRLGVCRTSPAEYLQVINGELSDVMATDQFCTMLYALIDTKRNTLTYAAAGSPPPLSGAIDAGEVNIGDGSGLPLGVHAQATYENRNIAFPAGSYLFLYSDVLPETVCAETGALETSGVVALVEAHKKADAYAALDGLLSRFLEKAPDVLTDDLTAVWLSR
ncbi:MAG: fused response regulator/phosphatase, partial [Rhodospirillales bacterium]|nr:fused response regulator/phosphatase [Rhodospirillales bacterium]